MDFRIWLGLLARHLITTLGGGLVVNGYATSSELDLLAGGAAVVVGIAWSIVEKRLRSKLKTVSIPGVTSVVLLVFLFACAGQTPRQKFYMGEVAFYGAQTSAATYLKTPYGKAASSTVLAGIAQASAEGTAILDRLRPLVPAADEKVPDLNRKLMEAGFDTLDSVVERLNETLLPAMYKEQRDVR